jgi:STE24 endopeptidase
MSGLAIAVLALIGAKWAAELWLERLNRACVRAHAGAVPAPFRDRISPETYAKTVDYTLAQSRWSGIESTWDAVVLIVVLFSGALPWAWGQVGGHGDSAWIGAAFLVAVSIVISIVSLPLDWHAQFRIEERFGFNTTTQKTWWLDRLKGALLAVVLGGPLLALVLKLVDWMGPRWWLWAWGALLLFQLIMSVLAPVLILPLFNKFTPLPGGPLRERLLNLAERTRFRARSIQVMDGSKRSRHSNAFFTGFGRFRKIVLHDTLLQQLDEAEVEAVLAHEIGHFKKMHIPQMLAFSAAVSLAAFYLLAWLANQEWFYAAFGFQPGSITPAVLLLGLLWGVVAFWASPAAHAWSRRCEYQADAFAAVVMNETGSLRNALRKLSEKNLSNLTPHPFYSAVHYSHPALLERETALARLPLPGGLNRASSPGC